MKRVVACAVVGVVLVAAHAAPVGAAEPRFRPGAPGIGDPYFPLDGNGGYDVSHYVLDVAYDPPTDLLTGTATIRARAKADLSSFDLDLDGLTVRSVTVNGLPASWGREGQELVVVPRAGLRAGSRFTVVVRYDGVPETIFDQYGPAGFIHTDDGAVVIGQPHVAATWFPVNDHPRDTASYVFHVTVPEGLEAVANGRLKGRETSGGRTTWTWGVRPMASYLATATIGEFDMRTYAKDGIVFTDAIDPDTVAPAALPSTGEGYAVSQVTGASYKRLTHRISVPDEGADLSFQMTRDTEPGWDHTFVEAHTVGQDDWTTLPDRGGHTSQRTGSACPGWHDLHPFLEHYQRAVPPADPDDPPTCDPSGATGDWWAASGKSDGAEQWSIDLSRYAGHEVEVSIAYVSDDENTYDGVFVDDVVVSTGEGTTSFESDGDTLDGWIVPGPPPGSPANPNDWIAGTPDDAPGIVGTRARASLARQKEIIDFLADRFGRYPFVSGGGIVDDSFAVTFALENQTRPIYSRYFFLHSPELSDSVVVHELTHQWYGDSLAVDTWQHIWLNEGLATYAEWLWSEAEGLGTAQEIFEDVAAIPADDPFWALRIGDPGPDHLFDVPVYERGGMTVHQLRLRVGDADFFRILRRWAATEAGGTVTTAEFVRLAEEVSGEELSDLFQRWLFTPGRPVEAGGGAAAASVGATAWLDPAPERAPARR